MIKRLVSVWIVVALIFSKKRFSSWCVTRKKNYSEEGFSVNGETTRWRIEKLVRSHDIVSDNDNQTEIRIIKLLIES